MIHIISKPCHIKVKALFFLWFCLWCMSQLFAQQRTTQIIPAEEVSSISIDGNQMFKIRLVTSKTNDIRMNSLLTGEYQNKFQIVLSKRDEQINIQLKDLPFANIADDKISAHKVISAQLELIIPENLNILVSSDIAQLYMDGIYNKVNVELVHGSCFFNAIANNSTINTLNGQIFVNTANTTITASSKYGQVNEFEVKNYKSRMQLSSIYGDIKVNLD